MPLPILGAAAISAGGSLLSSVANSIFNHGEAKKNREFQREMYDKQVQDNIKFWNLQNEYNLPSAQLQRLKDAGLNPLLMYGEGGVQNVATGQIQSGTAPHGAQASHNLDLNIPNLALLQAQIANIEANTEKTEKESENVEANTSFTKLAEDFNRQSFDVRLAIQHGDLEAVNVGLEKMRTDMFNTTRITSEMCQNYQQARQYEVKRFNFDLDTMGERLKQVWYDVKSGRIQANASMKNAAAAWLNATTNARLSNFQIGLMSQEFLFNEKANPLRLQSMKLDNVLKRWDSHLKKATLTEKQRSIFNQELRNYNLRTFGSEELYKSQVGGTFRDISAPFTNLLNSMWSW